MTNEEAAKLVKEMAFGGYGSFANSSAEEYHITFLVRCLKHANKPALMGLLDYLNPPDLTWTALYTAASSEFPPSETAAENLTDLFE